MIFDAVIGFRIEHVRYRNPDEFRVKRAPRVRSQNDIAVNISKLLNNVLEDYDQHFRPGFNTKTATKVYIDLFVNTMGPVADLAYTYSFNCYFRQKWTDERLHFSNIGTKSKQLSLSMAMLDKIWKPDTYFWNGAGSYVHQITTPNRLVRLEPDGTILYSSRITVNARCKMDMKRYPLDKQACRLIIGSYAYSSDEVQYIWRILDEDKGVKVNYETIADLPQFSLTGLKVYDPANITRDRNYSALEVQFYFDRHFGYFLMNFYVPCALIVLLCWVAFFTKREATAERIGIGITNVLTIVLISLDSKTDSPKTDSPTALDVYMWICYIAHLICMIEFTVNVPFTRKNRFMSMKHPKEYQKLERSRPTRKISHNESGRDDSSPSLNLETIRQENVGWRLYYWMSDRNITTDPFGVAQNSISRIDRLAVVVAPIAFVVTILIYYDFYVNRPFNFEFDNEFRVV
ncbi:unnamed protein product [Caenorhabditis bovis]|uniref:Uncharacterized protein n=1 Tax=Caenorhabditis bovis TaxID=2654633 RepID=A0A8S1DYT3_9PELO|nr:unnamed protein product [Caenorhabditis bovis]